MKAIKRVVSSLVFLVFTCTPLFLNPQISEAATPLTRQFTLSNGETATIKTNAINTKTQSTKYIYQIIPTSNSIEAIQVKEITTFGDAVDVQEYFSSTYGYKAQKVIYYAPTSISIGTLEIQITNYSAGTVTYNVGLTTGFWDKSNPSFFFDQIDFSMDDYF